jgi:hypothetical protein
VGEGLPGVEGGDKVDRGDQHHGADLVIAPALITAAMPTLTAGCPGVAVSLLVDGRRMGFTTGRSPSRLAAVWRAVDMPAETPVDRLVGRRVNVSIVAFRDGTCAVAGLLPVATTNTDGTSSSADRGNRGGTNDEQS